MSTVADLELDIAIQIAAVAMRFGEIERATQHPDGRPESDTTHTVMLGLVALELAPPDLDRGGLPQPYRTPGVRSLVLGRLLVPPS